MQSNVSKCPRTIGESVSLSEAAVPGARLVLERCGLLICSPPACLTQSFSRRTLSRELIRNANVGRFCTAFPENEIISVFEKYKLTAGRCNRSGSYVELEGEGEGLADLIRLSDMANC